MQAALQIGSTYFCQPLVVGPFLALGLAAECMVSSSLRVRLLSSFRLFASLGYRNGNAPRIAPRRMARIVMPTIRTAKERIRMRVIEIAPFVSSSIPHVRNHVVLPLEARSQLHAYRDTRRAALVAASLRYRMYWRHPPA